MIVLSLGVWLALNAAFVVLRVYRTSYDRSGRVSALSRYPRLVSEPIATIRRPYFGPMQ